MCAVEIKQRKLTMDIKNLLRIDIVSRSYGACHTCMCVSALR